MLMIFHVCCNNFAYEVVYQNPMCQILWIDLKILLISSISLIILSTNIIVASSVECFALHIVNNCY